VAKPPPCGELFATPAWIIYKAMLKIQGIELIKNIQPVTSKKQLAFFIKTDDFLRVTAMTINHVRGEILDKNSGSALSMLKRVYHDVLYVDRDYVIVKRNPWVTVRETTYIVFSSLFGKIFMMKKTKKEFQYEKGYEKKYGDSTKALGELNVDGFNSVKDDLRENKKEIAEVKEQNKEQQKQIAEVNKRTEKLEKQNDQMKEQNDQMMALLKDMSKRL